MTDIDKVKELVQWVAKRAFNLQCSPEGGWHTSDNITKLHYRTLARIILSHPDLALIDHKSTSWAGNRRLYSVIPLAPAIKEMK